MTVGVFAGASRRKELIVCRPLTGPRRLIDTRLPVRVMETCRRLSRASASLSPSPRAQNRMDDSLLSLPLTKILLDGSAVIVRAGASALESISSSERVSEYGASSLLATKIPGRAHLTRNPVQTVGFDLLPLK